MKKLAAEKPTPTASSTPKPRYQVGQKLPGRVVEKNASTGVGVVELMDGTRVKGVPGLFTCQVDETHRFKVQTVGGDGLVKMLKRQAGAS